MILGLTNFLPLTTQVNEPFWKNSIAYYFVTQNLYLIYIVHINYEAALHLCLDLRIILIPSVFFLVYYQRNNQPINHPTTRYDGPDPWTKEKIPFRLNP